MNRTICAAFLALAGEVLSARTAFAVFGFAAFAALDFALSAGAAERDVSLAGEGLRFTKDPSGELKAGGTEFDDSTWTKVRVPHVWAISGPFDRAAENGYTGKLPWKGVRMSAAGDHRLPEKAHVVADAPGYNSWPMIQAMGGKLVCSYSRDNARPKDGHTIDPGSRDSYVRVSSDGGRTWSAETTVAADPKVGEVNEGIGLDSTGAALLWVRCWGKGRRHELYRTADGVKLEKIASLTPDPFPMQVMDPVPVAGLGLVSPWFAGSYRKGGSNSWGLLVSADDGRTWTQRVVEGGLSVKEWVTEPSLADLGNGRLLIVGRCEQNLGNQFQVTSTDNGKTWKKARTNIGDVRESTPSLVYDRATGLLANYYYHRGARKLKRRVVSADFIFDRPDAWPEPEILDTGFETRPYDAGNVKATRLGDTDCCAWYSGTPSNSTVVVTIVPKPSAREP